MQWKEQTRNQIADVGAQNLRRKKIAHDGKRNKGVFTRTDAQDNELRFSIPRQGKERRV